MDTFVCGLYVLTRGSWFVSKGYNLRCNFDFGGNIFDAPPPPLDFRLRYFQVISSAKSSMQLYFSNFVLENCVLRSALVVKNLNADYCLILATIGGAVKVLIEIQTDRLLPPKGPTPSDTHCVGISPLWV